MRRRTMAWLTLLLAAPGALAGQHADKLGRIDFPTSGTPKAQEAFIRGTLLLHSFMYEHAARAYREAQALDPDFAMAYWGEALTYTHPVWYQQDQAAARAVLARLAPTPEARLAKAKTDREKAFLQAVEILYGDGAKLARDTLYAEAMRQVHERFPGDAEAAAFYSLSLLGLSSEGRDVPTYMRAAAILEELFRTRPDHPGVVHYLIHAYDDPVHAPLGLRVARIYGGLAGGASHALHMPSHIFLALGMWDDVVASNEPAWAADRSYHALYWLQYAYLQQGRYRDARRLLDSLVQDVKRLGQSGNRGSYLPLMRAAFLTNTQQWSSDAVKIAVDPKGLPAAQVAADLFATGMSALRSGDRAGAARALADMRSRRAGNSDTYPPSVQAAVIQEQELDALIHLDQGDTQAALHLLEAAAANEDTVTFEYGPPDVVKPSPELLGEVLLGLDRPREAQRAFERALTRNPGRSPALLGLVRAATRAGDRKTADAAHAQLRANWAKADPEPLATLSRAP